MLHEINEDLCDGAGISSGPRLVALSSVLNLQHWALYHQKAILEPCKICNVICHCKCLRICCIPYTSLPNVDALSDMLFSKMYSEAFTLSL